MGSRFVTIKKFSELWGIPEKTVRYWIRYRKIPSVKLNGRRLIDVKGIEDSLADIVDDDPDSGSGAHSTGAGAG